MSTQQEIPPPIAAPVLFQEKPKPSQNIDSPVITTEKGYGVIHPNGSEGWLPTAEGNGGGMASSHNPLTMPQPQPIRQNSTEYTLPAENENHPIQTTSDFRNVSQPAARSNTAGSRNAPSMRLANSISGRTSRADTERRTMDSAFVSGAALTGPHTSAAGDDPELRTRRLQANKSLSRSQRAKIAKEESVTEERLSKLIKKEGKTEKEALKVAMRELENLQKVQKTAVKNESRIQASHATILTKFKKHEAAYLNAKRKYETSMAELNAEAETLENVRAGSRDATEQLQDKAAQVEALRKTLAVDNRERAVKLEELNAGKSSFCCF